MDIRANYFFKEKFTQFVIFHDVFIPIDMQTKIKQFVYLIIQ